MEEYNKIYPETPKEAPKDKIYPERRQNLPPPTILPGS